MKTTFSTQSWLRALATACVVGACVVGVACKGNSGGTGPAGSAAGNENASHIVMVEKAHDFGNVVEGESVKHVFVVKNEGKSNLVLDRVQTSCGCTVATLKTKDIPPGQTGEIEVTFNTQGRPGAQAKTITIMSNDPTSPRTTIEVKANVETLLTFEPRFASKVVHVGEEETLELWVGGKLASEAKLKIDEFTGEGATAELAEKTDGDKKVSGVRLKFKATKVGNFKGNLVVSTGVEKVAKLTMPVSWNAVGNVEISPRSVFFNLPPNGGTPTEERVLIVKSRKPDFKVKGVKVASGPFTAKFAKPDAGVGYEVRVKVQDGAKIEPTTAGSLEIQTTDTIEPTVTVAISISPRMKMPAGGPLNRVPPMSSMLPTPPPR